MEDMMKRELLFTLIVFMSLLTPVSAQEYREQIGHSSDTSSFKSRSSAFVHIVKFKSLLPDSLVFDVIEKRKTAFMAVPGLVQKYYLRDSQTQEFCGVYLWATKQDYLNFKATDLAKSAAQAYQIEGNARVELFDMIYPLR